MAAIPSALTTQTVPSANVITEIAVIPNATILGTASVRVLNAGNILANFSLWFVPSGQGSAQDQHLLQYEHPLGSKASNVDFGIAVNDPCTVNFDLRDSFLS